MTRNYYRTGNHKPDHSTCGSIICNYDFGGYTSIADMVEKIISDWEIDEKCKKNAENRDKNKKSQERD